jgi:WD40 repeat protein
VAFSPDGRLLAGGSRSGNLKIWQVASGQALATVNAHQGSVYGLAFSPDGRTLATVGEDHLGRLWDLAGLSPRP